jgi:hypothetical protein
LDAGIASEAAAGAEAASEAGAGATTAGSEAATGASSFLEQAVKAIANKETSKSDFFMLVLSKRDQKIRSKCCDE